jgi:signal transduction histidine kinase
MHRALERVSGMTLARPGGSADLSRRSRTGTLRRAGLTGLAVGALIAGVAATSAAVRGVAFSGVVSEDVGGHVISVSPIGFAYGDGIRSGQRVLALIPADDPTGWRLESTDGRIRFVSEDRWAEAGLAASLPVSAAGVFCAVLAVLFVRTRRQWVLPAASVAFLASSGPLALQGDPAISTVALAATVIPPAVWVFVRPWPGWLRAAGAIVSIAFVAAWALARLDGAAAYDVIEPVRNGLAIWGAVVLLADRSILPALQSGRLRMTRPRMFDVGFLATSGAIALVLVDLAALPPLIVGGALVLALGLMPAVRKRLGPLEDALLADVRAEAAAAGAEEERSRLAHELHDVPLQELIGILRRLEIKPGTEAESDDLRALAGHLRTVAADLRPPVLDDFGLPAALEHLAEELATESLPVRVDIHDATTFSRDGRPPDDVELGVYRIAAEAVGNAVRHSGASAVWLEGEIGPSAIDLTVRDDGRGLDAEVLRAAARRRHFGIASMHRRAQAIDAELSIEGPPGGTRIRVAWQQ